MERVSAWKRLAGTGKGALGVLDCGAALGMPRSHGIARGREGITLSWGVLNNSTRLWREQDLGARAWWVPPGGPGCLACLSRQSREGTNLYNPKLGSQSRETITSQMLRPALFIHQDHSGRRSPGPSIPALAPWKVRTSILILQLTGTAARMATSQQPISLLQGGLWQGNQGSEGLTPAPHLPQGWVCLMAQGFQHCTVWEHPSITHHSTITYH